MAQQWTVLELIRWTGQFFGSKGIDTPRLDAEVLLAHVLGVDRIHLYTGFDRKPAAGQLDRFRQLVRRRAERCPTAYLVGSCEFYSLPFKVTPDVLVPRPETELLVDKLVELCAGDEPKIVVELGTGSGCIAVCVALKCPHAVVYATDVSAAALAVAGENASRHGVADTVRLHQGDLFDALAGLELAGKVDVLAANAPYLGDDALAAAMPEVREYEPRAALYGGPDGLDVIRRIAAGAGELLAPGGWLLLEIGCGQAQAARQAVAECLDCRHIEIAADLQHIPRLLMAHA